MAPPPAAPPPTGAAPGQAGKFKPRKPAPKKPSMAITPGVSSSIGGQNVSHQSQNQEHHRANTSSSSGGRGRGGREGGRGGGRGGRGGRSGRMPIPQGRVFFTGEAAQANPSSSSRKLTSGIPNKSSLSRNKQQEGEEMIVGEVTEGVGAAAIARAAAGTSGDQDADRWGGGGGLYNRGGEENAEPTTNLPSSAYTYVSSSDDEEKTSSRGKQQGQQQQHNKNKFTRQKIASMPTCLPDPETVAEQQHAIKEEKEQRKSKLQGGPFSGTGNVEEDAPMKSPFVDLNMDPNRVDASPLWMLFKLPTRLPRIHPRCTVTSSTSGIKKDGDIRVDAVLSTTGAEDIILPITEDEDLDAEISGNNTTTTTTSSANARYDDTLKDIAPGKYGKIIVYKSGKTVLVIGDDPTKQVPMLVMEGIRPSFYQQVVSIDPNSQTFTPLGEVQQTAVIIPDVDAAFATTLS